MTIHNHRRSLDHNKINLDTLSLATITPKKSLYTQPIKAHRIKILCGTPKIQPDKVRFCVDCTPLNVFIKIGPPTFDSPFQIIDKLRSQHNTCFTQIDIKNAFHTIPINLHGDDHLWFMYKNIKYSWRRMPFGIKDAPNHFNLVLQKILADIPHISIYFDNILIATPSFPLNVDTTAHVLARLNDNNIPINSEKSIWFTNVMPFLGMIITDKGVQPDPSRIDAIANYPTPTTPRLLQSFLGTVNYNRPFQAQTAELTAELYQLSTSTRSKSFNHQTQQRIETY